MRRALVRCYPARWRERYGEEFAELLAERPLGPYDVADILLGALDAHLHLRHVDAGLGLQRGVARSLRIGGAAAIVGGLSWIIALGGSGLAGDFGLTPLWSIFLLLGTAGLLVALIGLSAFQARTHPLLVWSAFALPGLGAAVSIAGSIGMSVVGDVTVVGGLSPWAFWAMGTIGMMLGSALFAVATWRTRALSRRAAVLLLVGSLSVLPMLGLSAGGGTDPNELLAALMVGSFGSGWAWLGASAVRMDRRGIRTTVGPAFP
jgi:hypothetical protein